MDENNQTRGILGARRLHNSPKSQIEHTTLGNCRSRGALSVTDAVVAQAVTSITTLQLTILMSMSTAMNYDTFGLEAPTGNAKGKFKLLGHSCLDNNTVP